MESNSEESDVRRVGDEADVEIEECPDEEEADTDLETDRLLGQQRTDDQGFYDDKVNVYLMHDIHNSFILLLLLSIIVACQRKFYLYTCLTNKLLLHLQQCVVHTQYFSVR